MAESLRCSYCGEVGHSIQECRKWKGKEVATPTSPLEGWLVKPEWMRQEWWLKMTPCAVCGRRGWDEWAVSDEDWKRYVPLEYQDKEICRVCYESFKKEAERRKLSSEEKEWFRLPFEERVKKRRELEIERLKTFLAGECVSMEAKKPIPPLHELDLEKIARKREALRTAYERSKRWFEEIKATLTEEELLKMGKLLEAGKIHIEMPVEEVRRIIKEASFH